MALAAAITACSADGGDGDRGLDALSTPTFGAEDGPGTTTGETGAAGEGDASSSTSTTSTPAGATNPSTTTPGTGGDVSPTERELVAFDDPVGDAVGGIDDDPPPWTDLAGGSLERQGSAYRLVIRVGGDVPEAARGPETMNIASFYDTDDDGSVDYEIWVNLGPDGWGAVWYDDQGNAAPGEASNVTVVVDGDELRLLFPDVMLGTPGHLRFSLASEYGELSVIGSDFARRDDAPDDDEAVRFPN